MRTVVLDFYQRCCATSTEHCVFFVFFFPFISGAAQFATEYCVFFFLSAVLRNVQYRQAIERHATVTSKKNLFVKLFEVRHCRMCSLAVECVLLL